ncbi:MAG: helix-turn-helix transcriptional regulator [Sphingomonadaceae bacterium]
MSKKNTPQGAEGGMLLGSHAIVRSNLNAANFSVELIDYRWDAGSEVFESQSKATLLWRMEPNRLDVQGQIGDSRVENFGQLMLLPPQTPLKSHGPIREAGHSHVVACRFDPSWLERSTGLSGNAIREDMCIRLANRDIAHGMQRLWGALSAPGFAHQLLAEGLAATMAVDLAHQLLGSRSGDARSGTLSARQMRMIEDYLASEENWPPSVARLSSLLNLSDTHFRRLFKASNGQTVHDYVEDIRLNKAKLLLRTTDLPLKVISHRLGFSHPSAFSAAFQKLARTSPRAFRRNGLNHAA